MTGHPAGMADLAGNGKSLKISNSKFRVLSLGF